MRFYFVNVGMRYKTKSKLINLLNHTYASNLLEDIFVCKNTRETICIFSQKSEN